LPTRSGRSSRSPSARTPTPSSAPAAGQLLPDRGGRRLGGRRRADPALGLAQRRNDFRILKATPDGGTAPSFFKLVWGAQFGFGVRTAPRSPNASGLSHKSADRGCPSGCLYDILADESEFHDISRANPVLFARMLKRQSAIGLTVHQTNYSDVSDSECAFSLTALYVLYPSLAPPLLAPRHYTHSPTRPLMLDDS
jgi:hypothetical protein